MSSRIIGMRVDPTSYEQATAAIVGWGKARESRYVCVANVHMVMEAHDAPAFRDQVNAADLVTPDGVPLVWMLRRLDSPRQQRVYGPRLALDVLRAAEQERLPVGFFGSTPATLERLAGTVRGRFPGLEVAFSMSPPFRALTPQEDDAVVASISASGVRILFVGLGCPKQEQWMAAHRGRIWAVMLGVGAAFDFLAGTKPQAPAWVQESGLEWFYRLLREPTRLWWRYLYHNPRFAVLASLQLLGLGRFN